MRIPCLRLGEGVEEATLTRWLVKVGDQVEVNTPLCEVATDKCDAEIPSPTKGIVRELFVAENATFPIPGTDLCEIDDGPPVRGEPAFRRLLRDEDDF